MYVFLYMPNLGAYTCQAYNGLGPADSATYVLRVLGPIARSSVSREDQKYLSYVVDAPTYSRPPPPSEKTNGFR